MEGRVKFIRISDEVWRYPDRVGLYRFKNKVLEVVEIVNTKVGPAYKFRDAEGNQCQILTKFAIPVQPHFN